jgi:hypothetical protein
MSHIKLQRYLKIAAVGVALALARLSTFVQAGTKPDKQLEKIEKLEQELQAIKASVEKGDWKRVFAHDEPVVRSD